MPVHDLGPGDGVYFEHVSPSADEGVTFVFFNALTGDAASWEGAIAAPLRENGHGSLLWNYRGQARSPFNPERPIEAAEIVADATELITARAPARPVYVGLSIGGLFAADAHIAGVPCEGLVLINTLRRPGPRLEWMNEAVHRCALVGGAELIRDLFMPLLAGPAWLAANRGDSLEDRPYAPLPPESGTSRLLAASKTANWDIPYERLDVPAIVMSGLQDRVFFDAADVAELAARMPRAERVDIADVGHLITLERPEAVVEACLRLAARIP